MRNVEIEVNLNKSVRKCFHTIKDAEEYSFTLQGPELAMLLEAIDYFKGNTLGEEIKDAGDVREDGSVVTLVEAIFGGYKIPKNPVQYD